MKASKLIIETGGAWPMKTKRRARVPRKPRQTQPQLPPWKMGDDEAKIHEVCEHHLGMWFDEQPTLACKLIGNAKTCAFIGVCQVGNYPADCPYREELLRLGVRNE